MSTTIEAPTGESLPEPESTPPPAAGERLVFGVSSADVVRGSVFGAWVAGIIVAGILGGVRLDASLPFWLFGAAAILCAGTRWRMLGLAFLAASFCSYWAAWGLPFYSREAVILWLIAALGIVTLNRPGRSVGRLVAEWIPFALVLIAYDYSRGAADAMGMPLQVMPQIDVDKWLFFGHVPTVWLQQEMLRPNHIQWWEALISLVYLSHFLATYVLAAWLWFKDHDAWWNFTKRFVTLSFVGVATYALVPAAPPWMAAQMGKFGSTDVFRTTSRGFEFMHVRFAGKLLSEGQAGVNLTAAVPSLHAAFSSLVSVTLWRRTRNKFWRALIVIYPLWMGFALVFAGEHYVADILLGWIYVLGVTLAWDAIDRRKAEREAGADPDVDGGGDDAAVAEPVLA